MLNLYRRHRANCKSTTRRAKCSCPIWAQGILHGQSVRCSLELSVSVSDACDRWIADCEARKLQPQSIRKYKEIKNELVGVFGSIPVRQISVDDVRKLRESWKYSALTTAKRLELIRAFFKLCEDSGWTEKNPAKFVKLPKVKQTPTLPFSDQEIEKLLWAVDSIREIHPQIPEATERKLRAIVLLVLHSGMRISDAVVMTRDRIKDERLLIYTQKTGTAVWCPLPKIVLDALTACDEGSPYYFWSGKGKMKSMITEWQERMKKACLIAGIPDGHFHRLRDTFSVRLLERGVPLEAVAVLLGNTVQVCQKHYAPWVKSRQTALETAVKGTWV